AWRLTSTTSRARRCQSRRTSSCRLRLRWPGALGARQLYDLGEAPVPQQARGDRSAAAALAVDDERAALRHLGYAPQDLSDVNAQRARRRPPGMLVRRADVEERDVFPLPRLRRRLQRHRPQVEAAEVRDVAQDVVYPHVREPLA